MVHEISRDKEVVRLTDISTLPVQLVKVQLCCSGMINSYLRQTPSLDVLTQEQQNELSALSDNNDQEKVMVCGLLQCYFYS